MEALLGAVIGGLFALVGAWAGPLIQSRQDNVRWLRGQRASVYTDACLHAEKVEAHWQPEGTVGAAPEIPDGVSARLALVGHPRVRFAWAALLATEDLLSLKPELGEVLAEQARQGAMDLRRECRLALRVDPKPLPPKVPNSIIGLGHYAWRSRKLNR